MWRHKKLVQNQMKRQNIRALGIPQHKEFIDVTPFKRSPHVLASLYRYLCRKEIAELFHEGYINRVRLKVQLR